MKYLHILFLVLSLSACSLKNDKPNIPDEAYSPDATLGAKTKTENMLKELPAANTPITLSVYEFNDLTGQNKPGDTPQYSRAVTQGGLSILKKALLDAGSHSWFRVLERGGLENLLQERKIIRAMRSEYASPNGNKLPALSPLLYSGILLEGGIVAYESNVMTGGAGARYLGIGASDSYSRDMVTIYLRLVSVKTGEVLLSVNSSKTIYSTSLSGGVYMFVSYDKLAESELGYTLNEPPQLAVRQAIELGVYAMIMEGYSDGLWNFKDDALGQAAFMKYAEIYLGIKDTNRLYKIQEQLSARSFKLKKQVANLSRKEPVNQRKIPVPQSTLTITPKPEKVVGTKPVKKAAKKQSEKSNSKPKKAALKQTTLEQIPEGWYVHVFAVRSVGEVEEELLSKISSYGLPVMIQKAAISSIPYYRILVGAYETRKLAEDVRNELQEISENINNELMKKQMVVKRH